MKTTPTTKILATGTINSGFEQSQVCCPTGGSSGNCRPLPRWQDRAVVLATGKAGRCLHHQRHRSGRRSRDARKTAFG